MKFNSPFRKMILAATAVLLCVVSCKDNYESDASDPQLVLTANGVSLKAPGRGQYRIATNLVDSVAVITVDLSKLSSVSSFTVTKTLDGVIDATFGSAGVATLTASGSSYDYNFVLSDSDLDKLVVLTFSAKDANGTTLTSDLSLTVSLTPRQNIPRKKWLWTSRLWVTNNNSQDLKDCEKDNYYLFNSDSTVNVNYGTDTGAGDCLFDGFTIYDKWWLTGDDKYFILQSHGLFDAPGTVKIDSFVMKTLSVSKLEMQIGIDLSVFGLGTDEQFLYQYTAQQK